MEHSSLYTGQMSAQKPVQRYCSDCGISIPAHHSNLCDACIEDIVAWLEEDDSIYQAELAQRALEHSHQHQFGL